MSVLECLRGDLKRLVEDEGTLPRYPAFLKWQFDTETAIRRIFPDNQRHLQRFLCISFEHISIGPGLVHSSQQLRDQLAAPRRVFVKGMREADAILHSMTEEVRKYWSEDGTSLNPQGAQSALKPVPSMAPAVQDASAVFVVHGRNIALREAMFTFLNAIGLHPLEWSEARAATKQASPYIGEILDRAFSMAQAVVVLMTPDDEAWLKEEFRKQDDPQHETTLTGQARPNVLFEAGMAMGREPERTVLVEVGTLRPFSDVVGRHTVRLDDSTEQRQELAMRLKTAGCPVCLDGTRWHRVGSFEIKTLKKPDSTPPKQISPTAASIEVENVAREDPRAKELYPKRLEVLMFFFDEAMDVTANEIARHFQLLKSAADYYIDELLRINMIERSDTELGIGWAPKFRIATAGRELVMKMRSGG